MIIDHVTIENFGVYAGRQTIDLSPPSLEQPVILIGGLNGGGKTTLLDAIQLALYGKFAPCSNRGNLAYLEYLRRSINQSAAEPQARIEIGFRHKTSGKYEEYTVTRSWRESGERVSERLTVRKNDEIDHYLSENWVEAVEQILPRRIANLFLFDGEQIESYASSGASQELIKTAVHSLLGIDVVDQLERDLSTLKQQKIRNISEEDTRSDILSLERELEEHESRKREIIRNKATNRSKLDALTKKLENIEMEFEQKGGALYARSAELEAEQKALKQQISDAEDQMRELAAGEAPLCLVKELIEGVVEHARLEQDADFGQSLVDALSERDRAVLKFIKEQAADKGMEALLNDYLASDRAARKESLSAERIFSLSKSALDDASLTLTHEMPLVSENAEQLLEQHRKLSVALEQKSAEVESIPAPEVVSKIIEKRAGLQKKIGEEQSRLDKLEKEYASAEFLALRAKQSLEKKMEHQLKLDFKQADDERVVIHATRVQDTLKIFRKAAVEKHLEKIQGYIMESFAALHRKKNAITDVKIDPEEFSVELINKDGKHVRPERLSAGERQLLAVATLWGLAKASKRQLPTVIDTPLGRLDSSHRGNLVDLYFPKASHQVILLSTDEEISRDYLKKLQPAVGSMYELRYSEFTGGTEIIPGYFEKEEAHVH